MTGRCSQCGENLSLCGGKHDLYGPWDLAGLAEAASFFRTTKQVVTNWRKRYPDFPQPIADLKMSPIFSLCALRDWERRRNSGHSPRITIPRKEPMIDRLIPVPAGHQPMKLDIHKSQLLEMVNAQLQSQGQAPIPKNCQVTVKVPGGGDYSGDDLELDDKDIRITIRWNT